MKYVDSLRTLSEFKLYTELKQNAEVYIAESADNNALPLLAIAYAALNDVESYKEIVDELDSGFESLDVESRVDYAVICLFEKQLDKAKSVLMEAATHLPRHPLLEARLASYSWLSGHYEQSINHYRNAINIAPEKLYIRDALIDSLLELKSYGSAQSEITESASVLERDFAELPETVREDLSSKLRSQQLSLWVLRGELAQAESWLDERCKDLSEAEWTALISGFANELERVGKYDAASVALEKAVAIYPTNIELVKSIVLLSEKRGCTRKVAHYLNLIANLSGDDKEQKIKAYLKCVTVLAGEEKAFAKLYLEKATDLFESIAEPGQSDAEKIANIHWQLLFSTAVLEGASGEYEKSSKLYTKLLELTPESEKVLSEFGKLKIAHDDLEGGVALFEKLKIINPLKGYGLLFDVKEYSTDEDTLNALENMVLESEQSDDKTKLLLGLATARDKLGQFNKAFELAATGNDSAKDVITYELDAHREYCARLRDTFIPALFKHRQNCGIDSDMPVFVVGMPCSGVSLVETILSGHSKIFTAGELDVIPKCIAGLQRWERNIGSGRLYPDCVDDITPIESHKLATSIIKELEGLKVNKPDAAYVVDTLSHNFENIGLIKFLFPKAKIISVTRDPRDIGLSTYFNDFASKNSGMGYAYNLNSIGEQLADHAFLMHHWLQVFPNQILEVSYESLVDDLEGATKRMLNYIGVQWEEETITDQLRQSLYAAPKSKWRSYKEHLIPLIKSANKPLADLSFEGKITLPTAGLYTTGIEYLKEGDLDGAELNFKKMLHHNPEHAACNFALAQVYIQKNQGQLAIPLMEMAIKKCPWKTDWQNKLAIICQHVKQEEKQLEYFNN